MTLEFGDAVCVITGAGNGIGRSIALAMARRGTKIVVSDIVADDAERVAQEVRDLGSDAIAVVTDVSDPAAVEFLADRAFGEFGRVDILCNNAGVTMRPFRPIWEASVEDYRWMTGVNYLGVVWGIRAFVPRMRQQPGHKHIVNTSSMSALSPTPGHGAYAAAKTAVTAISDQLREEFTDYGDDFGVTVLHPGRVETKIAEASENFRPPAERSENREVQAYRYVRPLDQPMHTLLDPKYVGDQLIRAIEANAPYCLTHPASEEYLRTRLSWAIDGYFANDLSEIGRLIHK